MKALSLSLLALVLSLPATSHAFENIASSCVGNQLTLVGDTAGGGSTACVLAHAALRVDHENAERFEGSYAFESGDTFTFRLNSGPRCEVIIVSQSIHCDSDNPSQKISGGVAANLVTLIKRAPRVVYLDNPVGQTYALFSQVGRSVVCASDTRVGGHAADTCEFFPNWR